jgi:hypothetical protein
MTRLEKLKRLSLWLQASAIATGVLALIYRATLYWALPRANTGKAGIGDLLDFALAMLLFLVCALCASSGVAISVIGERSDKRHAYQAFFVGVLSFLAYDLVYPYLPRLM